MKVVIQYENTFIENYCYASDLNGPLFAEMHKIPDFFPMSRKRSYAIIKFVTDRRVMLVVLRFPRPHKLRATLAQRCLSADHTLVVHHKKITLVSSCSMG